MPAARRRHGRGLSAADIEVDRNSDNMTLTA
jgi:hypothetical protein